MSFCKNIVRSFLQLHTSSASACACQHAFRRSL